MEGYEEGHPILQTYPHFWRYNGRKSIWLCCQICSNWMTLHYPPEDSMSSCRKLRQGLEQVKTQSKNRNNAFLQNKLPTQQRRQNSSPALQCIRLKHCSTRGKINHRIVSHYFRRFSKRDQTEPFCICMLYLHILWIKQIEEDLGIWALCPR